MVFSDLFFLFAFLPAFMLCYLIAKAADGGEGTSNTFKNSVLVLFSLLFYAWGEPIYVFLMIGCVLISYLAGIAIDKMRKQAKVALTIGICANLLILGIFKYAGFIAQTLCDLGIQVTVPKIALPIGISFYIFQSISYLVDVYRQEAPVQHRIGNLLLYISMFPQLIAGPIVRYDTVAREITDRSVSRQDMAEGIYRFLIGLGKKVIIANQLSEISDQFLTNGIGSLSTLGAWVGIVAYTLQIYFDFSGYSDMAIGIGRCMGFHFKENFNHPYCCNSITDFWRRWHISLGSFFRDYVYIPLGGNRNHQALNIMVVWFLTGAWHGASWNFILWGLYFGIIVMAEKYTLLKVHSHIPAVLLHIYSMLIVIAGWGLFYFDDFGNLTVFFNAFVGNSANISDLPAMSALTDYFWLWMAAMVLCLPIRHWGYAGTTRLLGNGTAAQGMVLWTARIVISLVALALSVALLVGATNNAFIYTRF